MGYDENGLGIAEMTFLALNYPETYDTIKDLPENESLELARKFIEAYNENLITK